MSDQDLHGLPLIQVLLDTSTGIQMTWAQLFKTNIVN